MNNKALLDTIFGSSEPTPPTSPEASNPVPLWGEVGSLIFAPPEIQDEALSAPLKDRTPSEKTLLRAGVKGGKSYNDLNARSKYDPVFELSPEVKQEEFIKQQTIQAETKPLYEQIFDAGRSQLYSFNKGAMQIGTGLIEAGVQAVDAFTPAALLTSNLPEDQIQLGLEQLKQQRKENLNKYGQQSKLASSLRHSTDWMEEDIIPGFWTKDLPEALGTSTAFYVTGGVGQAAGIPTWMGVASLGAAVNSEQMYIEAGKYGADESQATIAYLAGIPVGMTEAVPVMLGLERMDKASGGAFSRTMKSKLMTEAAKRYGTAAASMPVLDIMKTLGKSALEGFVEESIQEIGNQWGNNLIASDIAGYDPDREMSEGLLEAGEIGGAAGAIMNVLATSMGVRVRPHLKQKDFDKIFEDRAVNSYAVRDANGEIILDIPSKSRAVVDQFGPEAATKEEWTKLFEGKGVKKEEIEWAFKEIVEARNQKEMDGVSTPDSTVISKEEMQDAVDLGGLELQEQWVDLNRLREDLVSSGSLGSLEFDLGVYHKIPSNLTLNNKLYFLNLPPQGAASAGAPRAKLFEENHFTALPDTPNIAHARISIKSLEDGTQVFHVDEIQSDVVSRRRKLIENQIVSENSVREKPVDRHWERIMLTRLIQEAQKQGFDYISFASAADQINLYGTDQVDIGTAEKIQEFEDDGVLDYPDYVSESESLKKQFPNSSQYNLFYSPLQSWAPELIHFVLDSNGEPVFDQAEISQLLEKKDISITLEKLKREAKRGSKVGKDLTYSNSPRENGMKASYDVRIPNILNKILKPYKTQLTSITEDGVQRNAIALRPLTQTIKTNLYSTQGTPSGLTVEGITKALRKLFGARFDLLLKIGRIKIVDKVSDLPGGTHPTDTTGLFTKDGISYLVAENLSVEDLKGLVLHEVGIHSGLKIMLGETLWNEVLNQVTALEAKGDPVVLAAAAAIAPGTSTEQRAEEILGSIVQQNANLSLMEKIVAGIRAWWFRLTGMGNLTPADLVMLAKAAVKMQTRKKFQQELGMAEISYAYRKRDKVLAEVRGLLKQKQKEAEEKLQLAVNDRDAELERLLQVDDVRQAIMARAVQENWTKKERELVETLLDGLEDPHKHSAYLNAFESNISYIDSFPAAEILSSQKPTWTKPPEQYNGIENPSDFLLRMARVIHWKLGKKGSEQEKQNKIFDQLFSQFEKQFFNQYLTIPYRIMVRSMGLKSQHRNGQAAIKGILTDDNSKLVVAYSTVDLEKDLTPQQRPYTIAHELSHVFHQLLALESKYGATPESRDRATRLLNTIAETYITDVIRLSRTMDMDYLRFAFSTNRPFLDFPPDLVADQFWERMTQPNSDPTWSIRWGFNIAEMTANFLSAHVFATASLGGINAEALQENEQKRTQENYSRLKTPPDFPLMILLGEYTVNKHIANLQKAVDELRNIGPLEAIWKGLPGESPETRRNWGVELDRWNTFIENGLNLHQIAQINPHILPLQNYLRLAQKWNTAKKAHEDRANNILEEMKDLGAVQMGHLSEILLTESVEGEFISDEKKAQVLTPEAQLLYTRIQDHFKFILNEMQEVSLTEVQRLYADNPVELALKEAEIRRDYATLFERPYFPLMRFGDKGVQVIDRETQKLVEFHLVETELERESLIKDLRRQYGETEFSIAKREIQKADMLYQGLPLNFTTLLEKHLIASGQPLSVDQKQIMKDLSFDYLPTRSFKKHFKKKRGVSGYSKDIARSLAAYTQAAGGHLARVKYGPAMLLEVEALRENARNVSRFAPAQVKDESQREKIANWMVDHYNYIMSPDSEWAALRSFGFFWYLGFNVKSALVNASQVPLVTFPALAADFNEIQAGVELAKATKLAISTIRNPDSVEKDLLRMIEQGTAEGWLDQSLATELAITATAGMIDRFIPLDIQGEFQRKEFSKLSKHTYYKAAHYASLPFHVIEKLNRKVTAIAGYNLMRNSGATHETAVEYAQKLVNRTQYEYSKYNRPKFMRGKSSALFLFKNYVQNTLFFAFEDKGGWRFLLMLLLIAGLRGLPGAEDLLNLFDLLGTEFKKQLGMKDPYVDLRTELKKDLGEFVDELGMDPDLFLHGLGRHSMGLTYLAEELGVPFPDINLSSSLSMGHLLPGMDMTKEGADGNYYESLGRGVEAVGGPLASMGVGVIRALTSNDPDYWKRSEHIVPVWMKNASKAVRYSVRGEEATRTGEPIAKFNPSSLEDRLEIMTQALGFMPTKVSEGWEGYIAKQNAIGFYDGWKTELLSAHNRALEEKDAAGKKEALTEILKYNQIVPFPEMGISQAVLSRSWSSYYTSRMKASRNEVLQRQYIRLGEEYQAAYARLEQGDNSGTGVGLRDESEPSTFEQLLRTPQGAPLELDEKGSR